MSAPPPPPNPHPVPGSGPPPGWSGQPAGNGVPGGGPVPPGPGGPQPAYQHGPQPGYQQGPQPGYQQGPQPGYQQGPPPGWSGAPQWSGAAPAAQRSPDSLRRGALILAPILVVVGLTIPQSGSLGWVDYTLWAIFAAAMASVPLLTLSPSVTPQRATLATIATGALVAYWVVIVLPGISSNGGFLQTLGVGCAVVAAWLRSGRA
jgi:hypothetical protein